MSKYYNNTKSGIRVVSGPIDTISSDGKEFTIKHTTWSKDKTTDKYVSSEETVVCMNTAGSAFENIAVGDEVCAYGYGRGTKDGCATIGVEGLLDGKHNHYVEVDPTLAIIYGRIKSAGMNNEKDENGNPKLKADGITARKPHFDIKFTLRRKDEDGDHFESHTVSRYRTSYDKQDVLESFNKKFKDFNPEEKNYLVCIVTAPAEITPLTFKGDDGQDVTIYYARHMGTKSIDTEIVDPLPKWEDRSGGNVEDRTGVASGTAHTQETQTQTSTQTTQDRPTTLSEAAEDDEPDID